jgi:hypothetical protein
VSPRWVELYSMYFRTRIILIDLLWW